MAANKMILFLSVLNSNNKEIKEDEHSYLDKEGQIIKGTQTNEAATKYFIKYIKQMNEELQEIIILATPDVVEKKINSKFTTKEYFEEAIKKWCVELDVKTPKFIYVETTNEINNEINIGEDLKKITANLDNNDSIYLDSTGGYRTVSYIFMLLIRLMEYIQKQTKMVLYSQLDKSKSENNKIIDVTNIYNMFDLLNGVNEFARFGSDQTLAKYFTGTDNDDVKVLVSEIGSFLESIKLCKTYELEDNINKLRQAINKVENTVSNEQDIVLLSMLMPFVKKKFYIDKSEKLDVLNTIRWCVNNSLIQQALTIYVEKIPKFLYDNNILRISNELIDTYNKSKKSMEDVYAKVLYEDIMNRTSDVIDIKKLTAAMDDINEQNFSDNSFQKHKIGKISKAIGRLHFIKKHWEDNNTFEKNYCNLESKIDNTTKKIMKELKKLPNKSKSYKGNFNIIKSRTPFTRILLDLKAETKNENRVDIKISCVDTFKYKNMYNDFSFSVNDNIAKELMFDYLYVKTIRNQINHASDNDNFTDEQKIKFENMGYTAIQLTLKGISESLEKSLDRIVNILNSFNNN